MWFLNMKLIYCFIISIFIISCSNANKSQHSERFDKAMNKYFGKYNFVYNDLSARGGANNYSQLGYLKIKKNELSNKDIKIIYDKLLKDGWRLVYNEKKYKEFCFGKDFKIGILFPTQYKENLLTGDFIVVNSIDEWNISLFYDRNEILVCE